MSAKTWLYSEPFRGFLKWAIQAFLKGKKNLLQDLTEVLIVNISKISLGYSLHNLKHTIDINVPPAVIAAGVSHTSSGCVDKTVHGTILQTLDNTWDHTVFNDEKQSHKSSAIHIQLYHI